MSKLESLQSLVESRWSLRPAAIEPIKVRENAVFAVHLADGGKVCLRVHRRGYHSDVALQSERTWMQALAVHGIEVPRHVLSNSGRSFETAAIDGFDGERQVDVFHWIEGQQLGSVEQGLTVAGDLGAIYRNVGRIAARVHEHSSCWRPPETFRRHAWDAEGLAGAQPFWGRFWELEALSPAQRSLFQELRNSLYRELSDYGQSSDRYGHIHADLVPENILVHGGSLRVIDFDDAGFGWYLFELATSLYFIRRDPIYEEARDALVAGYREIRPLSDEDLARLPMFLAARGTTYLGWVHTRRAEPVAQELTLPSIELAEAAARDYLDQT